MKSSDEMINSLLERRKQYIDEQSRKKALINKHLKFCIVITCIITIVSFLHFGIDSNLYSNNSNIKINKVSRVANSNLDVIIINYEPLSDSEKEEMISTFEGLTGIDYEEFLSKIPDVYTQRFFYYMKAPEKPVDFNNKNYIIHDYVFSFRVAKEQPTDITISICPFEKPLRDVEFLSSTDIKSEINGVEFTVYSIGTSTESYIIEFFYKNLYYEIQTYDVSIEEIEKLLFDIL
ncbi:MAG: hypothetical protein E7538_02900 [Ruminococcaceae bacterium]|nr:hypothetical protein [Oscillospiraceae bacterium]